MLKIRASTHCLGAPYNKYIGTTQSYPLCHSKQQSSKTHKVTILLQFFYYYISPKLKGLKVLNKVLFMKRNIFIENDLYRGRVLRRRRVWYREKVLNRRTGLY